MTTAKVAELKAKLSSYLSRVKTGEEVLVTERNIPVARLVPIEHEGEENPRKDPKLRAMERKGLIRLGTGRLPKDFWKMPRARDSRAAVRSAITEERDEER
jgi:prevent-host-death family protein